MIYRGSAFLIKECRSILEAIADRGGRVRLSECVRAAGCPGQLTHSDVELWTTAIAGVQIVTRLPCLSKRVGIRWAGGGGSGDGSFAGTFFTDMEVCGSPAIEWLFGGGRDTHQSLLVDALTDALWEVNLVGIDYSSSIVATAEEFALWWTLIRCRAMWWPTVVASSSLHGLPMSEGLIARVLPKEFHDQPVSEMLVFPSERVIEPFGVSAWGISRLESTSLLHLAAKVRIDHEVDGEASLTVEDMPFVSSYSDVHARAVSAFGETVRAEWIGDGLRLAGFAEVPELQYCSRVLGATVRLEHPPDSSDPP